MPDSNVHRGLAGVYVDETRISNIFEDSNTLAYYGYPVQNLAEKYQFEDVAYLLWNGELPTEAQREEFIKQERSLRRIPADLYAIIHYFHRRAHPMDMLRTAVSFLGMHDPEGWDLSPDNMMKKSVTLFAKLPTIIAANHRIDKGLDPIDPREDLSFSENFFYMYFGEVPEPEVVKCFDASMTFYAEHSFNASTFTAMTIISSLSDIYGAITGAISSLKGVLHGGANEAVMEMLLEIESPDKAQAWIDDVLAGEEKKRIMGFGHRVYRDGDSRVPHMTKYFHKMAEIKNEKKWVEISNILAKTMLEKKNIHPNLDFPVGPAYYMMGFDIPTFTPIFVMSRITGWTAHIMEELEHNKLVRPLAAYTGENLKEVPLK